VRLSAHIRRDGPPKLSAKGPSPVQVQREAFAESKLSVKPSPRGKGPSPRGSQLSAETQNPVVATVDKNIFVSVFINGMLSLTFTYIICSITLEDMLSSLMLYFGRDEQVVWAWISICSQSIHQKRFT
jgi:hypothetical protein